MNRRGFLGSILAACVAPAIVRADSLMRVIPRDLVVIEDGWTHIAVVRKGGENHWYVDGQRDYAPNGMLMSREPMPRLVAEVYGNSVVIPRSSGRTFTIPTVVDEGRSFTIEQWVPRRGV